MPVRYMGTKRHLASQIARTIKLQRPAGPVLDLFGGMGSVAEELAPEIPVLINDFLGFAFAINQSRLQPTPPRAPEVLDRVTTEYLAQRAYLSERHSRRIRREDAAIADSRSSLAAWFSTAPHAARSDHYERVARSARSAAGRERYQLATLYFSAGYFSTRQAIDLDSIRSAIDQLHGFDRSFAIGAWLIAAARLANGPGHTAQHLRPNTDEGYARIRRLFERDAWDAFRESLTGLEPLGTQSWRRQSKALNLEAHALLGSMAEGAIGLVYADPPYTRDQYSRFYHVYETLYRYDYPGARGNGRTPMAPRPQSRYSAAGEVEGAFAELFELVAALGTTLVLSYPSEGLLHSRGRSLLDLADRRLRLLDTVVLSHNHSTLGGSKGRSSHEVLEHLMVFVPSRHTPTPQPHKLSPQEAR